MITFYVTSTLSAQENMFFGLSLSFKAMEGFKGFEGFECGREELTVLCDMNE